MKLAAMSWTIGRRQHIVKVSLSSFWSILLRVAPLVMASLYMIIPCERIHDRYTVSTMSFK